MRFRAARRLYLDALISLTASSPVGRCIDDSAFVGYTCRLSNCAGISAPPANIVRGDALRSDVSAADQRWRRLLENCISMMLAGVHHHVFAAVRRPY